MTEQEVRLRLRRAIGEHHAPAGLAARASHRLQVHEPVARTPRFAGVIAALVTIAVVLTLAGYRLAASYQTSVHAVRPSAAATARPSIRPLPLPPVEVLAAANLDHVASLVTPLDLSATSDGITLRLVAVYADSARTVAILQSDQPSVGSMFGTMYDSAGLMNYSSGGPGVAAPYGIYVVDGPPKQDSDGLGHIRLTFTELRDAIPRGQQTGPMPSPHRGDWEFRFAVPVRPGLDLGLASKTLNVGTLPITLETVEATPTVVHVQALVGAQGQAVIASGTITFLQLIDSNGNPVQAVAAGGGVTVPKQQLTQQTANIIRLNFQWPRPVAGGNYIIRFRYQGSVVDTPVSIPALAT